jgi:hypothetical protein
MKRVIDNKCSTLCMDMAEFRSGEVSDYPCNGCCMAEAEYSGTREPRVSKRLSVSQVAELTGTTWCSWVEDCVSRVEGGDDNIAGECGLYMILSMISAMTGNYSEIYEIEHDGLRRVALIKL